MITTSKNNVEVIIAKLYIFLLPFRLFGFLEFIKDVVGPLVNYVDTIFLVLGLILWFGKYGQIYIESNNRPLFKTIRNSILYLNISSVIMACVMYIIYGNCNGTSPFIGIIPMELFYFQYLLMFLYNIRVFQLLSYKTIVSIISKTCWILLIIGYLQVFALIRINSSIYDALANLIGGLVPSSDFYKLPLTTSEGAGAGGLLGMFVLPFLFGRYLYGDKKSLYQLILWIVPLYYTQSTTAYLLFILDVCIYLGLMIRYLKTSRVIMKVCSIIILAGIGFIGLSTSGAIKADMWQDVEYMTVEKAVDKENASTTARMVPLIINWGCFKEMPVMGVGNGLQGYFFRKYFPMNYLYIPGSSLAYSYNKANSEGKIANGGTFLPGYFSGYGVIGIIVLINIIVQIKKAFKRKEERLGIFKIMFIMGAIAFIVMSISSEMYCVYYAWFILSIPFMNYKVESYG